MNLIKIYLSLYLLCIILLECNCQNRKKPEYKVERDVTFSNIIKSSAVIRPRNINKLPRDKRETIAQKEVRNVINERGRGVIFKLSRGKDEVSHIHSHKHGGDMGADNLIMTSGITNMLISHGIEDTFTQFLKHNKRGSVTSTVDLKYESEEKRPHILEYNAIFTNDNKENYEVKFSIDNRYNPSLEDKIIAAKNLKRSIKSQRQQYSADRKLKEIFLNKEKMLKEKVKRNQNRLEKLRGRPQLSTRKRIRTSSTSDRKVNKKPKTE